MADRKVLVTGAAGFIGAFLVKKLLEETDDVIVGLDNLNSYYDPGIKDARLRMLAEVDTDGRFAFVRGDLCDAALIERLFAEGGFDVVVNLAAQAGVRYSIENPRAYLESNLVGFFNVLEACRHHPVKHLVYASSSSVYGGNKKVPFSEEDRVDSPVSLYAATKKSNELMAAAYSKLYSIPATGLRFFTVYGPMGRPDMAYFGFTEKLRRGETIKIFNMGDCRRDFTYVDDIVEGVRRVMDAAPEVKMGEDGCPSPPTASTTSATPIPRTCSTLSTRCSACWLRRACSPPTTTLSRTSSSCPCSPATCPSPTPIPRRSSATWATSPRRRSRTA